MKVFISADIEGIAGIAVDEECNSDIYQEKMSKEVAAVCKGVLSAGAEEVLIKDAHCSALNIDHSLLPEKTTLIRGFNGHPYDIMYGIDKCDVAFCIGYHIHAGGKGNPLAHTLEDGPIVKITINGLLANEYLLSSYISAYTNVPIVFVSGDKAICDYVFKMNSNITTFEAVNSEGYSVFSYHPETILRNLEKESKTAMSSDFNKCFIDLPEHITIKITFYKSAQAYRFSFYPGMSQIDDTTIMFETDDFFEVMRMIQFVIPF